MAAQYNRARFASDSSFATRLRVAIVLAMCGCATPRQAPPEPARVHPEVRDDSREERPDGGEAAAEAPRPQAGEPPPPAASAAPVEAAPTFPPPNVAPPHERSAQPGDGVWQRMGNAALSERAALEPPILARTVVHPHPTSRFISVTVAAIDLARARIGYVSGTEDPKPRSDGAVVGLVPPGDLPGTVAIFNGGFQPQHGWWGMRVGSDELVKPRADGCTVALFRDGRVTVAPWPRLEPVQGELAAFRQTPPCLIADGAPSSRLASGNLRVYGGDTAEVKTQRRSGVGVDAKGAYLFFAVSEEGDARHLAEGLRAVGATGAAQLDINWNWTRFLLVGDTPEGPRITSTLMTGMNHGKREYVARPTARDFFYVVRKDSGRP